MLVQVAPHGLIAAEAVGENKRCRAIAYDCHVVATLKIHMISPDSQSQSGQR
jgi:hypothetical protein